MLNACKKGCALAAENRDISEKIVPIEPALRNRQRNIMEKNSINTFEVC